MLARRIAYRFGMWNATRLLMAVLLLLPALESSAAVVAADDFEDERIGLPPVSPDVGSYNTFSGEVGVILGFPGRRVRVADDATDAGSRFGYEPTETPTGARVEYVFRIEDTGTAVADNAFVNEFVFFPPGTNLSLLWAAGGNLRVRFVTDDGGEDDFTLIAFAWDTDIDWPVAIEVDPARDRYRIWIQDALYVDRPLPGEVTTFQRFSFASNFATTGAFQLDDVLAVPEPGPTAAAAAALPALVAIGRSTVRRRAKTTKPSA